MADIQASYTYTIERYRMLIRAREQRRGSTRWRRYVFVTLIYLVSLLVTLASDGTFKDLSGIGTRDGAYIALLIVAAWAGLMLVVMLADAVLDRLIYPLVFNRYLQANKHLSIGLADDGVRWSSDNVEGTVAWPALKDMTTLQDGSGAVLWLGKVEGIVLPADAFASRETFDMAVHFARSRIISSPEAGRHD